MFFSEYTSAFHKIFMAIIGDNNAYEKASIFLYLFIFFSKKNEKFELIQLIAF
ncbi:hypothetical protein AB28_0278 [Raoultella ornithinolytica 2-156-04_S1_C2]|nr:hypothetical protein AB00_0276 [Raoultella ornithinolytica 2-156-04_S1_C1]KDX16738.1 hypothetical protein AB28_0278 [Raoultella ornithinolytica 2-156-04_S1_C2]